MPNTVPNRPTKGAVEPMGAKPLTPRFAFMFQSLTVRDNMRQILSRILRIPVAGKPITIIDISGVPSEIVDVVVSVLCRLIFEFALWSDRGRASAEVKALAVAHARDLEAKILEMQAMQRTLLELSRHCRGNERPECPILDDLAG